MLMESCCCVAVVMELDVFWECNLSSVDFSVVDKKASSLVSPLLGAMLMDDDNSSDVSRFDFVVL